MKKKNKFKKIVINVFKFINYRIIYWRTIRYYFTSIGAYNNVKYL